ncbi:MAG TPA: hypothetical protein VI258_13530 [Rhodanobacteraceae bacterium]
MFESPALAQRIEAPLELMYAPDASIVAGKLVEINPVGRIVLEPKDMLFGKTKPPEKLDIRVPKESLDDVKTGERYVVAYSQFRRDPRKAVGMVPNKEGVVAIVSPGIEPAVFRDTPAIRAILKAGRSEHGRESRKLADLLLTALSGDDAALRYLAAGELAYEPELGERLTDADRARIEATVRDVKTPIRVRMVLLEAASRMPKTLGDWWKKAALDIVTTTPTDGYSDKASDPVLLILTAFDVLDRYSVKVPPETLKRWVWNPNPALVERVCVLLRREGPDLERPAIHDALADPKLSEATRKFLNDHLRQLDRIDERKRAQKEGSGRS